MAAVSSALLSSLAKKTNTAQGRTGNLSLDSLRKNHIIESNIEKIDLDYFVLHCFYVFDFLARLHGTSFVPG